LVANHGIDLNERAGADFISLDRFNKYRNRKNYDEAESLFNRALEGKKHKLGDDHPRTLETKNDFSVLYKEQARYDEAEPLLLEAVKGRIEKLGNTFPPIFVIKSRTQLQNL
jgi:tetratricopeptide (TPR) repeat protein